MAKFKLPWDMQWTPDGERESAEKELGTQVDTYKVVRANFTTDIYGEGRPEDIGLEFIVSSPEEHDSDDRLSEWERATIAEILELNPDYEIAWDEWDREGGETEWYSKAAFVPKPQEVEITDEKIMLKLSDPLDERFYMLNMQEQFMNLRRAVGDDRFIRWLCKHFRGPAHDLEEISLLGSEFFSDYEFKITVEMSERGGTIVTLARTVL